MLLSEASSPEPILATGPALARRLQPCAGAGAAGRSGSEVPLKGEAPLPHPLQHSTTAPIPTAVLLPGRAVCAAPRPPHRSLLLRNEADETSADMGLFPELHTLPCHRPAPAVPRRAC